MTTRSWVRAWNNGADDSMVQRAYTAVLRHFVRAVRPPCYLELAVTPGLKPDREWWGDSPAIQ